mgnify:CR=1 FL=1|jgi:hypothetical protein
MTDMRIDKNAPPKVVVPAQVNDTMRRLQIGIAGVLTVLLLVGMAGLIGDRARESVVNDAASDAEVKMPGEEVKTGGAPLEELGVQPVSKDENKATPVKVPQAAPAAATVPDLEPDPELQRARKTNP